MCLLLFVVRGSLMILIDWVIVLVLIIRVK